MIIKTEINSAKGEIETKVKETIEEFKKVLYRHHVNILQNYDLESIAKIPLKKSTTKNLNKVNKKE